MFVGLFSLIITVLMPKWNRARSKSIHLQLLTLKLNPTVCSAMA